MAFLSRGAFSNVLFSEPQATRLRLMRNGKRIEIPAEHGLFILSDVSESARVDCFEAVQLERRDWIPVIHGTVPYSPMYLADNYAAFRRESEDEKAQEPFNWAYDLFDDLIGEEWLDAVVQMLAHSDDFAAMCFFGAQIYSNGDWYYERMERELAAGTIKPDNLVTVLMMEKPEFMDDELARRHKKLLGDAEYAAFSRVLRQGR